MMDFVRNNLEFIGRPVLIATNAIHVLHDIAGVCI